MNLKFFLKSTRPSLPLKKAPPLFPSPFFSWRRLAALGNMKANFHCAHLHNLSPQGTGDVPTALLGAFFSKTYPSFLTLKEGSTSLSKPLPSQKGKDVPTALLGAQTASLYGWRTIRGLRQQRSCGFLCGDGPAFTQGFDKGLLARCFFRKPPYPSLTLRVFRKPTSPPLPLREDPPLISVFSPQGKRGNRPTRCSNRFAIRLADHQRSTPAAELRFFVRG